MRLFFGLLLTTAVATSQTLPTPLGPGAAVGPGGAIYFDLECLVNGGITVTSLGLSLGPANAAGTVDVYLRTDSAFPVVVPGWQPFSMANPVTATGPNTFSLVPLNRTIPLGQNCVIGVAVVASGPLSHFVRPPGGWGTSVQNPELRLTFGLQSAVPFVAAIAGDAMVQVNYVPGGQCPEAATVTSFGVGCLPGAPLTLTPMSPFDRPVQETPTGITRSFWAMTSGIPITTIFHAGILGLADIPGGISLSGIGLDPRCRLYCQADVVFVEPFFFGAPPTWPWLVVNIPPIGPSWWGIEFCVQSAALTTAFGIADLTSNGLKCRIGAW